MVSLRFHFTNEHRFMFIYLTNLGPLYVIVEYAPNGNLKDFLRKHRSNGSNGYELPNGQFPFSKSLTYKELINYGYQVNKFTF